MRLHHWIIAAFVLSLVACRTTSDPSGDSQLRVANGLTVTRPSDAIGTYHLESEDRQGRIYDASIVFLSPNTALTSAHVFFASGMTLKNVRRIRVLDMTKRVLFDGDPNDTSRLTVVVDPEVDQESGREPPPRADRVALIFAAPLANLPHGTVAVADHEPAGGEVVGLAGFGYGDYRVKYGASRRVQQALKRTESVGTLRFGANRSGFTVREGAYEFVGRATAVNSTPAPAGANNDSTARRGHDVASTPGDSGGAVAVVDAQRSFCLIALATADVSPDEVQNRGITDSSVLFWWATPLSTPAAKSFLAEVRRKGGVFQSCSFKPVPISK